MRLSSDRGLNPRLTVCPRCGNDGDELVLLGDQDRVYKCVSCSTHLIGNSAKCPDHPAASKQFLRRLGEHEKVPGSLCSSCRTELEEHAKIVAEGGIYWKCEKGHSGVIRAGSQLAIDVRSHFNMPAPEACGIEFDEPNCPACHPELVGGE